MIAGAVGVGPDPFTLNELYWMSEGRVISLARGIGMAFDDREGKEETVTISRADPGMKRPPLKRGHMWVTPKEFRQVVEAQQKGRI